MAARARLPCRRAHTWQPQPQPKRFGGGTGAVAKAEVKDGKLVKVETITKKNKLVAYEAVVTKGGKKSEIQVGPEGKPLDHEE